MFGQNQSQKVRTTQPTILNQSQPPRPLPTPFTIFYHKKTKKKINEQLANDGYFEDESEDFDDPLMKEFDEKE